MNLLRKNWILLYKKHIGLEKRYLYMLHYSQDYKWQLMQVLTVLSTARILR